MIFNFSKQDTKIVAISALFGMPYTVFVAINTNYKGDAKYILIYKNDSTGVLKN